MKYQTKLREKCLFLSRFVTADVNLIKEWTFIVYLSYLTGRMLKSLTFHLIRVLVLLSHLATKV